MRVRITPGRGGASAGSNNDWYRFHAARHVAAPAAPDTLAARACAERDLDAVLARTGLSHSDRILEVGCGRGRHTLALARRGFGRVVSVDIAPEPLEVARALAREAGLPCEIRQQDFSFVDDGPYRGVLSLYDRSVCGFPTEGEDARSLRRLAGLLDPGGWLVFGIDDWPSRLPDASTRREETELGVEWVEVVPDPATVTCTHRVSLLRPDGRRETHALTRRHYSLAELEKLLARCGFTMVAAFHRLAEERPYVEGGEGLFVYARRGGEARSPGT